MKNPMFSAQGSAQGVARAPETLGQGATGSWLLPLVTRLHFYIGLLVGPFLLVAALSGIVYALTPQLEDAVYHHALYTESRGGALPIGEQIATAQKIAGAEASPAAVRPAPGPGTTTRVMFNVPGMNASEHRAIFIDPVTGAVCGDLTVYGTSGVLPIRSWLDQFHRGLLLGDAGRLYSELAASWLWILALGGLTLWFSRRRRKRENPAGWNAMAGRRHRVRNWHGTLGVWALLAVLFFSVTGLTWSQYAGNNISSLRAYYGWGTPSVSTKLQAQPLLAAHAANSHHDEHAEHRATPPAPQASPALFDAVLEAARTAGVASTKVEIRPPRSLGTAWTVTEIDRSWPTRVDAIAIDPRDLSVVDHTRFESFPLAAKLTRWGIDAHMGALFGLPNQLVLILGGTCIAIMVVWGYMMWWRKRPTRNMPSAPRFSLAALLRRAPLPWLALIISLAVALGIFLPVMGASLLVFLLWDAVLQWRAGAKAGKAAGAQRPLNRS
jgi:uncharacterized iron-regulated membrane protein